MKNNQGFFGAGGFFLEGGGLLGFLPGGEGFGLNGGEAVVPDTSSTTKMNATALRLLQIISSMPTRMLQNVLLAHLVIRQTLLHVLTLQTGPVLLLVDLNTALPMLTGLRMLSAPAAGATTGFSSMAVSALNAPAVLVVRRC